MNDPQSRSVSRRCDVAVIGGSSAGLAAALQLQRQQRSTITIDSGDPRNAPAAHMHGYLGFDGAAPADLVEAGRAEVRRYGGEVLHGAVTSVVRDDDGFVVDAGNARIHARRVVAATGVVDVLPDVAGIEAHWGSAVLHCPFCHGYEVRDRRLVQLLTHPLGLHPAGLFAHLADQLTLVVDPTLTLDESEIDALEAAGVVITSGTARRVIDDDGVLAGVELIDGSLRSADALVVTTQLRPRIEPFAGVGLVAEAHETGIAHAVTTSPTGETDVAGLYAAGNLTDPTQQVLAAAADGSRVGAMVAFDLAREDRDQGHVTATNVVEWDARYAGDEFWSGEPNGSLVVEVEGLTPGRALDIGAGEGADALWLASRGWEVTATDVAPSGLARLASRAESEGLTVQCLAVDANALQPFGDEAFDLVTLFYGAIPRTSDNRTITSILDAVAPGGTLLVVGHPPHDPGTGGASLPWDRASFVSIGDIDAVIRSSAEWDVVVSERRDRPHGSSTHHHHDRDVVFRAVRHR